MARIELWLAAGGATLWLGGIAVYVAQLAGRLASGRWEAWPLATVLPWPLDALPLLDRVPAAVFLVITGAALALSQAPALQRRLSPSPGDDDLVEAAEPPEEEPMPLTDEAPAQYQIVVARERRLLHDLLREQNAGDPAVRVVLDRRHGERRRQPRGWPDDSDRRQRRALDDDLQTGGFFIFNEAFRDAAAPRPADAELRLTAT
jgi:hypothetical protein